MNPPQHQPWSSSDARAPAPQQQRSQDSRIPSISLSGPQTSEQSGQWPKILQREDLNFTVHVYQNAYNGSRPNEIECWTYVSDGISKVNQPEVVMSLRRRPEESPDDFSLFPLEWMRLVYLFAEAGVHIEDGQMIQVAHDEHSPTVKLGKTVLQGNAAMWAEMPMFNMFIHGLRFNGLMGPEVYLPTPRQHAMALRPEEAAVALEFGPTRVIAQLGSSVRWFPYPPYIDRDRDSCCTLADQAGSVRSMLPFVRIYGINAMNIGQTTVLTFPLGETKKKAIHAALKDHQESKYIGFDCFMDSQADAGLTWKAGQDKIQAYRVQSDAPPKAINLAFIVICTAGAREDTYVLNEDGFSILLSEPSLQRAFDAIAHCRDISIPVGQHGMVFVIQWKRETFHNPLDGREYTAPGGEGWTTFHPSQRHSPAPPSRGRSPGAAADEYPHVKILRIIMLSNPPSTVVDPLDLASYIKAVQANIGVLLPRTPPAGVTPKQMILEIETNAAIPCEDEDDHPPFQMAIKPDVEGLDVRLIMETVVRVVRPPFKINVSMVVQVVFGLWGYVDEEDA